MPRTLTWSERIDFVQSFADPAGLTLVYVQPWHLRISHPDGRRLDYFPKSVRATWVSSGRWFRIEDIEKYLNEKFKT